MYRRHTLAAMKMVCLVHVVILTLNRCTMTLWQTAAYTLVEPNELLCGYSVPAVRQCPLLAISCTH